MSAHFGHLSCLHANDTLGQAKSGRQGSGVTFGSASFITSSARIVVAVRSIVVVVVI